MANIQVAHAAQCSTKALNQAFQLLSKTMQSASVDQGRVMVRHLSSGRMNCWLQMHSHLQWLITCSAAQLRGTDSLCQPAAHLAPRDLVERIGAPLGLPYPSILASQELADVLTMHAGGRNPSTIAAAAVLLTAQEADLHLEASAVSKSAGITTSTLQGMLKCESTVQCLAHRAARMVCGLKRARVGEAVLAYPQAKLPRKCDNNSQHPHNGTQYRGSNNS